MSTKRKGILIGPDTELFFECNTCGGFFSKANFVQNKQRVNGIRYTCLKCYAKHQREVCSTSKNLYRQWQGMKNRCLNANCPSYKTYQNRTIYPPWMNSYRNFERDLMPLYESAKIAYGPNVELSLDRTNNEEGYHPTNARFISHVESNWNRAYDIQIEYMGHRLFVRQWARLYGIQPTTVLARLNRGWTIERALNEPIRNEGARVHKKRLDQQAFNEALHKESITKKKPNLM
jgi:hypothetical protein